MSRLERRIVAAVAVMLLALGVTTVSWAQSGATRPRRVLPSQPTPTPTPVGGARRSSSSNDAGASATLDARAARSGASASTAHAFSLLEQKLYDAALKEAREIIAADASNSEAWKIAGFAEVNLKQYAEAATDLQRALDLQRAAGAEDANTVDALAQAYVRTEKFDLALPLLTTATMRAGVAPDPVMLFYRGVAEFGAGKKTEAERSFTQVVKADPKNSSALFYLGRIAFERKDDEAAIAALNRATLGDPRRADAWTFLTYSYLRRADAAQGAKADADYLNAVRASEGLIKVRSDEAALALHGQALIRTKQYLRAATALERVAANPNTQGSTLYLLGFSYSRAKNFPKAIAALERAAAKSPDDSNIYRELGYAYEVSKQYVKALATYEKGLALAPDDADFKQSAERVRPFAK